MRPSHLPTPPGQRFVQRRAWRRRAWGVLGGLCLVLLAGTARADRFADLERATHDSSWRVRLQAAYVLSRQHDPRVIPILESLLGDEYESVRGTAASALGDVATTDDTELIHIRAALMRATQDRSPLVRERATAALARLPPPPAHPSAALPSRAPLHIAIGGIGAKQKNVSPDLTRRLRELLVREFEHTPGLTIDGEPVSGFVIDSSITALNHRVTHDWVEVTCEISVIVGRLPSKAMVMMTSGGATVQEPKTERPERTTSLEADALEGAVKGAHENLLGYLRKMR